MGNAMRAALKKPVWDINMMSMCMMQVATLPEVLSEQNDVYDLPEFLSCMRQHESVIDEHAGYMGIHYEEHPFAYYKGYKTPSGFVPELAAEEGTVRTLTQFVKGPPL